MTGVPLVTSADSERAQRRAAGALAAAGLRAEDRLLVSAAASPALLAVVLGALRTGVVPVVLDPALPAAERAALAEDADAALDIGDDPARLLGEEEADLADVPLARPMHYTSGTTGRRKGVWSGVLAEDDARALAAEEIGLWEFGRATGTWCSPRCTTARRCGSRSTPCSPAARCCCRGRSTPSVPRR